MLDDNSPETSIGACLLTNVRPGIWIADMHMVQCPDDDDHGCQVHTGTVQVLDARHCELYLENKFRDGTWEYEDLGSHLSNGQLDTAAAAIFNRHYFNTPRLKNILDAQSWIRGRSNLLPRAYLTPVGVALSTNLMPNRELLSRFEAMRDTTRDGQIVSVRITQHLLL